MKTANQIIPANVYHPGIALREEINNRQLTVKEVAKMMDMAPTMFSEVLTGKRIVTTLTAIRLEEALGIDALFFLNMQMRYDYYTLKSKRKKISKGRKKTTTAKPLK